MNYRKACLDLISVLLRENLEQRFTESSSFTDQIMQQTDFGSISKDNKKLYLSFVKEKCKKISNEVYSETVDAVIEKTMLNLASVSPVFTDEEMREIYMLTKSTVGLKIIRNLDIMRTAFNDGTLIMIEVMIKKWQSPDNIEQLIDFLNTLDLD